MRGEEGGGDIRILDFILQCIIQLERRSKRRPAVKSPHLLGCSPGGCSRDHRDM